MAEFPAIPLWTDALIGDTFHLTPAQFGAYLRLLIAAWRAPDCSLPNDDVRLGRIIGDVKNWHRLRPVVMEFWTLGDDDRYRQKRLLREREWVSRTAAQRAAAGRSSALKRKELGSTGAQRDGNETATPTPTPIPINKQETNYGASRRSSLSFEGRIIRLNDTDYRRWKESFPEIDLDGALAALDAHYDTDLRGDDRKKWFPRCAGALANKNQEALERRQSADGDGYDPDIIH